MSINLFAIIASFGGGIIGATLGALPAITLWGLIVLYASVASVVTGNQDIFATIAFNPAFGPQVVYGGAIGSLTYAWKKGVVPSGLDILKPLASFNRADVMIAGGIFGVLGYLISEVAAPWPTDNIAISVVATGWLARLLWDRDWLKSRRVDGEVESCWPSRRELLNQIVFGAGIGIASSHATIAIGSPFIVFGFALMALLFIQMGFNLSPFHHIAVIASLIAVTGNGTPTAFLWAVIVSIILGIANNIIFKLWIPKTNSYIDPPVTCIAIGASIISALTSLGWL